MIGYTDQSIFDAIPPPIGIKLPCHRYIYVALTPRLQQLSLINVVYRVEFKPTETFKMLGDGKAYFSNEITFLELV